MNDSLLRAQVTIHAMKLMVEALEEIGEQLPQNPKLYALLSEAPLEQLRRLCNELNDYLLDLKQVPAVSVS
jgi:hypothetical protein